jgi:catechol 2,3-dioxygenase-like lactoylglutathione lyase family enzyme
LNFYESSQQQEETMKSKLGHLQVNIHPQNINFYKELFTFLGWKVLYQNETVLGVGGSNGTDLWFEKGIKDLDNDYDGIGTNHIAITVDHQSEVDEAVRYLQKLAVKALFGTPRHRPEMVSDPSQTMYQVMFESPDRTLFEVVYWGPKDK